MSKLIGEKAGSGGLQIYTFGEFRVLKGYKPVSEYYGRSKKVWELFKYFITMLDKRSSLMDCYEAVWGDEELTSNYSASLHNLVYRLRGVIDEPARRNEPDRKPRDAFPSEARHNNDEIAKTEGVKEVKTHIAYSAGSYYWNSDSSYWLDCQEFEKLFEKARSAALTDSDSAIKYYKEAIDLYKGEYLPDTMSNSWIMMKRNMYARMFSEISQELTELLRDAGRHEEILELCEKIFLIDPLNDRCHYFYINALMDLGEIVQAQSHYRYATTLLYVEMGITPTRLLKEAYNRIKEFSEQKNTDLLQVQADLKESADVIGAFLCDLDIFKEIYRLELRRLPRRGYSQFICLATIIANGVEQTTAANEAKAALDTLIKVAANALRGGDVVAKWSDGQLVLLMPSITIEDNARVMERIAKQFKDQRNSDLISVKLEYAPLL
jgi:two-component SAPR family response regulator